MRSHAGERGPGNTVIQEWLAMRYKAALEATEAAMGPRPDGFGHSSAWPYGWWLSVGWGACSGRQDYTRKAVDLV